ncbi:hypothetical protein Geob_3888 [Geotalea daltonii FRC-32]|uniref:Uncharacterized protein n=1 Tax=Geotalea daltonii (strain DSM 22248 / JCM 15807 / FRC-32) TaxID=316067 RepID=A0A068EZ96_GEODF|nr:hypothetical protein Geob_3888 [Geotalea daltonii FRC-32]
MRICTTLPTQQTKGPASTGLFYCPLHQNDQVQPASAKSKMLLFMNLVIAG